MALATLRWLTGRSPVSLLCLILPKGVMNSEMKEKFCLKAALYQQPAILKEIMIYKHTL
jgi:hypothetical protein